MSTLLPAEVIRRVAIRIGAYTGADVPTIDAAYLSNPLTTILGYEAVTVSVLQDDCLAIEQEIATLVSGNENNSWRNLISDVTANIVTGALIPSTGVGGAPIIGVYGEVRDASNFKPLPRHLHLEDIQATIDNPGGMFTLGSYAAAIRPPRLHHTRPNAVIDVCVYDYDARRTAIFNNAALLFPEAYNMYFYGMMTMLANADARLLELSNTYMPKYDAWRQAILSGRNVVQEAGD